MKLLHYQLRQDPVESVCYLQHQRSSGCIEMLYITGSTMDLNTEPIDIRKLHEVFQVLVNCRIIIIRVILGQRVWVCINHDSNLLRLTGSEIRVHTVIGDKLLEVVGRYNKNVS